MWNGFGSDNNDGIIGTVFRDMITGALALLMVCFFIAFVHMNPPKKNEEAANSLTERGNVRVEVIWDDKLDIDIDTWCKSPGDPLPVGYSNKSGPVFNLLRDDLGHFSDQSGLNYELMYARGLPEGEWACNIYWYANRSGAKSITPKINITISKTDDPAKTSKDPPKKLIETSVTLNYVTEEVTVLRWRMDREGNVVPGSMNNLLRKMYSAVEEPR